MFLGGVPLAITYETLYADQAKSYNRGGFSALWQTTGFSFIDIIRMHVKKFL